MTSRVSVFHQTRYQYDIPVFLSPHLLRLKPAAHARTAISDYALLVKPAAHSLHWQQDSFGNFVARIDFNGAVQELLVEVSFVADMAPVNPFGFFVDTAAARFPFAYEAQLKQDLCPYLQTDAQGPQMEAWLRTIDLSEQETVEFIISLNRQVFEHMAYTVRLQPGVQTSEESLEQALGSCRDSAWLLVQVLRHLGLAARFVSGYLVQLAGKQVEGNNLPDIKEDAMELHAWAEVFIPGAGWIGLDATSGLLTGEGHIPLACTAVPASAAPITGTAGKSRTTFTYRSSVSRLL